MTTTDSSTNLGTLEGLVLRDGNGILYEVPCAVVERYRVSSERADELSTQSDPAPAAVSQLATANWSLHGAVYAPSAPFPPAAL